MKSKLCCIGALGFILIWICAFFALPIVGMVFWFIQKTPEQFLLTCIGMCVALLGFGVFAFLSMYGYAKLKQSSQCHEKTK